MLFYIITILACSHGAFSGDVGKMMRAGPSISNSLVNLGKMDISFYFGKPSDRAAEKSEVYSILPSAPFPSRLMSDEPCPCSEFRSKMDSLVSKPSDIISNILRHNDLFKTPTSSVCCNSHEQVHEENIYFELASDPAHLNQRGPMKPSLVPEEKKITHPTRMRPKTVEIFLFPKTKDLTNIEFTKLSGTKDIKPLIKKVGKELSYYPLHSFPLYEENNKINNEDKNEVKNEVKNEIKNEDKAEVKDENKNEVKNEERAEVKNEHKGEVNNGDKNEVKNDDFLPSLESNNKKKEDSAILAKN